jgi:hypothetical protein
MPLILAVEPDRRQAAQLTNVIRRVGAELVLADTTEHALDAIGSRVPDLVLVPALLSPQDDAALAGALRVIAAAAHVRILTTPVLGGSTKRKSSGGVLAKWRRGGDEALSTDGCDPAVFGEQISDYLKEAAAERAEREAAFDRSAPHHVPAAREAAYDPSSEYDVPADDVSEPADQIQTAAPPLEEAPAYEEPPPAIEAAAFELAPAEPIEIEADPGTLADDEVLVAFKPVRFEQPSALTRALAEQAAFEGKAEVTESSEEVLDLSDQLLDVSADATLKTFFFDDQPEEAQAVEPVVEFIDESIAVDAAPETPKAERWMPPWSGGRRSFPRLEGVQVEAAPDSAAAVVARPEAVRVVRPPAPAPIAVAAKPKTPRTDPAPKEAAVVARTQPVLPVRPPAPAPVVVATKPKAPLPPLAPKEAAVVARPQPVLPVRPPAPAPIVVATKPKAPLPALAPKEAAVVARPQPVPVATPPAPAAVVVVAAKPKVVVVSRPDPVPVVRPPAAAPVVIVAKPKSDVLSGFSRSASEPRATPKEAAIVARPQPVPVVRPPAPAPIVVAPRPKAPPAALAPREAVAARPQSVPVVRPPAPAPIVAAAKRQEWLELIDSLRLDVDRLRAGRDHAAPVVSANPKEPVAPAKPKERRAPVQASAAKKPTKRSKKAKPVQDEWGFFDPEQCGFAALLAKLDEITEEDPDFDPKA